MTNENYDDLVTAIEDISRGLEHLTMLSLDLKRQVEKNQAQTEASLNVQ
ncbi:MAG: hypothetical protein ACOH5I_24370 [Oligoflexus sp.]